MKLGIDEAGRGCLGGPVVVAGVILPDVIPEEVRPFCCDSKSLSKKKREKGE